jgi:hypothetical protein
MQSLTEKGADFYFYTEHMIPDFITEVCKQYPNSKVIFQMDYMNAGRT